MLFQGKTVLITGGTSGIGKTTALEFAKQGAQISLAGRREDEGLQIVRQIEQLGAKAIFTKTDITQDDQVRHLIDQTTQAFGKIDIAFNNAGIEQTASMLEFTVEDYHKVFNTNVLGIFLSLKYQLPIMQQQGYGSIINTSSIAGHVGMAGAGIYIASKHAVEGITKTAALEMAKHGIRVNAVAPGAIETEMIHRFTGEQKEMLEGLAAMHPIGRIGTTLEVAAAVLFLASDAASFITGTSLPVDGGYLAQ